MPGEFGKDVNVMVPSDGDLTERHVCSLMFLVLTRRIGLGRFVDETKFQVCPLLPWACLVPKNLAKWHCSAFCCYLANIVQSWSN
jgi:hypothetical protein